MTDRIVVSLAFAFAPTHELRATSARMRKGLQPRTSDFGRSGRCGNGEMPSLCSGGFSRADFDQFTTCVASAQGSSSASTRQAGHDRTSSRPPDLGVYERIVHRASERRERPVDLQLSTTARRPRTSETCRSWLPARPQL